MLDRLPTHLWVMAEVRRCGSEGIPVVVARRGERTGGMVLLRVNRLEAGSLLLNEARDIEGGRLGWMAALQGRLVPDAEAQSYIDRAVKRDPDLWVVEIEDRLGRNPFEGRTLA
jgi:hypothetical protein